MSLNNFTTVQATLTTLPLKIHQGYDDTSQLSLSVTVILAIFIVITILGNTLVCLSFYKQTNIRKICYYPILSLAIADVMCGAVAMPAYIAKKHVHGGLGEGVVCDVFRFSYFFTEYASILSLTVISIERFVAVKMPIKHKTWLTSRKMVATLGFSWLDAAVISSLPFFWRRSHGDDDEVCQFDPTKEWSMMVILMNVFLPFLIMLFSHLYTVSFALRYTRRRPLTGENFRSPAQPPQVAQTRTPKLVQREREITRTFALVVGIFIICWGPSSFYYFIRMVCPECYGASFKDIKQIFNAVVKLLTFVNSCLNPFIYFWLNPALREAFIVTLMGKKAARRRRYERDELSTFNRSTSPSNSKSLFAKKQQQQPLNSDKPSSTV